ncbi:MAG: rhomboid family intramembrane serine protease [Spirochaetaceae bacterium]
MRIRYNAPVTLTFSLLAALVLAFDPFTGGRLVSEAFSIGAQLDFGNPLQWLRLLTHVVGHATWSHLISNFAFVLLLGPILEEKYGSNPLLLMMAVTALVTGLINVFFMPTGLLGASGIVFMMILLVSFTNIRSGEIPLTFILVVILYLAREVVGALREDSIAQFAHIAGGVCGSLFGFTRRD